MSLTSFVSSQINMVSK